MGYLCLTLAKRVGGCGKGKKGEIVWSGILDFFGIFRTIIVILGKGCSK